MLNEEELSRRAHNIANDYLRGVVSQFKYTELMKDIDTYFIEYKKKYNAPPESSWLAKELEEDRFFDYGHYTNPMDALNDMRSEFNWVV